MISKFAIRALLVALVLTGSGITSWAQDSPVQGAARFEIPATDVGLPGDGPIRRYDWFRQLWQARRSQWANRVDQDRHAVVLLGDSITQGWGEDFSAWFPGMKIANRGISGDTSRGVLIRLEEDVLALDPRAVVLLIGTNDLEEKATPETVAANLKLILAELARHNANMPIVLCQVFPSSASKSRSAEQIRKVNALYANAVKGNGQVVLVETWPLFADGNGDAIPAEFPDLLHPNLAGYVKWAAALRPIFATLDFLEPGTLRLHTRARLCQPLQRTGPHRLGIRADVRRRSGSGAEMAGERSPCPALANRDRPRHVRWKVRECRWSIRCPARKVDRHHSG